MSKNLSLLSIAELLGKQFFIPSYQRGYRWGAQQVGDLLDDLYTFAVKRNKAADEFYCLQPIVVKRHSWNRPNKSEVENVMTGWEVVDGQQRLTTIRIMLQYLISAHLKGGTLKEEYGKEVYGIHYETRSDSEHFLTNVQEDANDDVDFYHMALAHKTIREWFERQLSPRPARESILNTLINDKISQGSEGIAQIIWYELDSIENPIESFVRINLGKIPLTNAELIKALFLQKANFGLELNELARLRQLEIANEWDLIENTLQQPLFWTFLNKDNSHKSSRIELLLNLLFNLAIDEDPELQKVTGTDEHATFRYFYQLLGTEPNFTAMRDAWGKVQECFRTLQEWYSVPEWYHYIGYLITSKETLLSIYTDLQSKQLTSKLTVTAILEAKIKSIFADVGWLYNNIEHDYCIDLTYSSNRLRVRQLLLLFNIEWVVQQCKANTIELKFPFGTYNGVGAGIGWDVEHIDSTTENELRSRDTRKEWFGNSLKDLNFLEDHESLKSRILDYIKNERTNESFETLFMEVTSLAGEEKNDEQMKDSIGNLALLDAGTNRAYGNALFTTKRRIIIDKDKEGRFIPLCTKNVFLKYYDLKGTSPSSWTSTDMFSYQKEIAKTLLKFLPLKPSKIKIHA